MLGAHISPLVGIHLLGVLLASSWLSEPRLPRAPGRVLSPSFGWLRRVHRYLCAAAVLSGHVPSPWFDEPRQSHSPARSCRAPRARPQPLVRRAPARVRILRVTPCSLGTSPALGSASPGARIFCQRLRRCSCLRLLPVTVTSPPLQLPPLAACVPPRLRRCSCLNSLPVLRFLQSALCALCVFALRYVWLFPYDAYSFLNLLSACCVLLLALSLLAVANPGALFC